MALKKINLPDTSSLKEDDKKLLPVVAVGAIAVGAALLLSGHPVTPPGTGTEAVTHVGITFV